MRAVSDERDWDTALSRLGSLGTHVEGHDGEFEQLDPSNGRGQYCCTCGQRTGLGSAGDALRDWLEHRRAAVLGGAIVIDAAGKRY